MTSIAFTDNIKIIYNKFGLIITKTKIDREIKFTVILNQKVVNEIVSKRESLSLLVMKKDK